jgi:hypothetical protein
MRPLSAALMTVLAVAMLAGCLPNRATVSPDGQTFYFSLVTPPVRQGSQDSNIYALDIETGRLMALTDGPGQKGWCSLTPDGGALAYTTYGGGLHVEVVDVKEQGVMVATGAFDHLAFPWVIPSEPLAALAMKVESDKDAAYKWVLLRGEAEVTLDIPPYTAAAIGTVGVMKDRFAMAVTRQVAKPGDASQEEWEWVVYMVDLPPAPKVAEKPADGAAGKAPEAKAAPPVITLAAKWDHMEGWEAGIDLAFSADGKRLLAAVKGSGEEKGTRFFELDPAGKQPPKLLFKTPDGTAGPQWTSDAAGLVYLAPNPTNNNWTDVLIRRLDAKEPTVLAHLPGEAGLGGTAFFWMKDGKLRIYHASDDGVRLIETTIDGKEAKGRMLNHDRLRAQQVLADTARWLRKLPQVPEGEALSPTDLADKIAVVRGSLQAQLKATGSNLEEAWKAAAVWDEAPALPSVPAKKTE